MSNDLVHDSPHLHQK